MKFYIIIDRPNAAFPAIFGQFPQALPPTPLAAVAPTQREGKTISPFFKKTEN